jgi:hypothetical protein
MMAPVLPLVNCVKKILFPLMRIVPFRAMNAPLVEPPTKAVRNVPIAHPVNSKTWSTTKKFAPIAPVDLRKVKRIIAVVHNAAKAKKHQR